MKNPNEYDFKGKARQMETSFVITRLSRADLDALGFDADAVDDDTMSRLASKMENDYLEQLYWPSLELIADLMELPRKEASHED